jgi:hypothetical protein
MVVDNNVLIFEARFGIVLLHRVCYPEDKFSTFVPQMNYGAGLNFIFGGILIYVTKEPIHNFRTLRQPHVIEKEKER